MSHRSTRSLSSLHAMAGDAIHFSLCAGESAVAAITTAVRGCHRRCCRRGSYCRVAPVLMSCPSEDGAGRRPRPHRCLCRWFRCHYLSSRPHVLSLRWVVSRQKTPPNLKTLYTFNTLLQKTGSVLCSEVSNGYK